MSLFIKICGLKDENDVRAAVAAGADAIGFVFADSVRRVSPGEARAASRAAPAGVLRVAVMQHPADEAWQQVLAGFEPDVLQTDAEDFASLEVPDDVRCWPVYREGANDPAPGDEVYLYEGRRSGSGETVDWRRAAGLAAHGRMLLAGGLSASNVAAAIRAVRPWGVDVSSGVEAAPGRKDPQKISGFISAARAAESAL